jgi:hypothetical protein
MDHSIENLDDCVFDYLVSNKDEIASIYKIYHDITGETGHRCTSLNDPKNRDVYKRRFRTICYTLDNSYDNIYKYFNGDKLYLVYSERDFRDTIRKYTDEYDHLSLNDYSPSFNNITDVIEDLIDNDKFEFDLENNFDDNETIVHILVRNDRGDLLRKLLQSFDLHFDKKNKFGETPLDIATKCNNCEMVKMILEYGYSEKIHDLNQKNKTLRKTNTQLFNENNKYNNKINNLESSLYGYRISSFVLVFAWLWQLFST